jgi:NAD(P)-dependent dehydrogenase (short-subunit alcohol dehydrogenase family)
MNSKRLVIIGSGSDLVQPLIQSGPMHGLEVLGVNRSDWDMSKRQPAPEVVERIARFRPGHLIFAAGHNTLTNIHSDPASVLTEIESHVAINCLSFIHIALLLMKELEQPLLSIHAISSLYGVYGRRSRMPYSVSKHALEGAIKCLAVEFPQTQVLGYRPGFFETRLTRQNVSSAAREALEARIPKHRFGEPEEFSAAILSNILHPNPYYTGTFITVDGGMTAGGIFDQ